MRLALSQLDATTESEIEAFWVPARSTAILACQLTLRGLIAGLNRFNADPMTIFKKHAASIAAVQGRHGDACPVFTWRDASYKALPSGARQRKDNSSGGFQIESDLEIVCLVSQFAAASAAAQGDAMVNTRLTYLGHPYRIQTVNIAPGEKFLKLECVDAAQGL
jgi:hypothetical protein